MMKFSKAVNLFLERYGYTHWSYQTLEHNLSLIKKLILPEFSDQLIEEISSEDIERLHVKIRSSGYNDRVVRDVQIVLNLIFRECLRWKIINNNPCDVIYIPKLVTNKRDIWDADTFFLASSLCQDEMLNMIMHLAFSCTLRISEILALQWDRIVFDSDASYLFCDRILQRVNKSLLTIKEHRQIFFEFPENRKNCKTQLVLKSPKTASSVRKVYIPQTVVHMLNERKSIVKEMKKQKGFNDYNLVFCWKDGRPIEKKVIEKHFKKLILDNNLPIVSFHSLRHTSITYKLKLTNGDIKAVQGDSGHSTAQMVTDVYSHILDQERTKNAELFEKNFYSKQKNEKIKEHTDKSQKIEEIIAFLSELL